MAADPPTNTEYAINVTMMPQVGAPTSGQWGRGQLIFDANGDMYICTQASDIAEEEPALWRKLTVSAE